MAVIKAHSKRSGLRKCSVRLLPRPGNFLGYLLARLIGVGWRRRHGAACAVSVSIMTLTALATEASVGNFVCGGLTLLSSMVGQTPGDLQARLLRFA